MMLERNSHDDWKQRVEEHSDVAVGASCWHTVRMSNELQPVDAHGHAEQTSVTVDAV